MNILPTPLEGLHVIGSQPVSDHRGWFFRAFCQDKLEPLLGGKTIDQINFSHTFQPGAIRGIHFQFPPKAETKMVRCIKGRIWDVAVDLRQDSPTFLRWHAHELSSESQEMFYVPAGFGHAFQALEPDSQIIYLSTAPYDPKLEYGLRYDDPTLGITWPLEVSDISPRDLAHPLLSAEFQGVAL